MILDPLPDWALEDNHKLGIEAAISKHLTAVPTLEKVYQKDNRVIAITNFTGDEHALYGAPGEMATILDFDKDKIYVDFAWWNKPATRVAESIWLGFCTMDSNIILHKTGQWIDPADVVDFGNRGLHAVEHGVRTGDMDIETLDAALVAPGVPSIINFDNAQPDLSKGVYFNLFNNCWGTNFRMWSDDDARYRFVISLKGMKKK